MANHLVLVAGNIGAGKTSLTERIGQRLGWHMGYESVADNPYLSDFYADMRAWAFHLQVFFLGHRADQYLEAVRDPRSAILDRSIYEDFHIFTRALHQLGNMAERDYVSYHRLYNLVIASLPPPALLVYLKAPVPVLMKRILRRARNMETGITAEYLEVLDSFYDEWLDGFDMCPVLTIRSDDLDYVHEAPHLETVVRRIQEKLAGKETVDLRG